MAERRFSLSDYLDARCAELTPLFAFSASSIGEARQWRSRALAKARDLLGEMPEPVQLQAEILETSQRAGIQLDRVVFDSDRQSSTPCLLLTPPGRTAPSPAVVCLHGLNSRKEDIIERLGIELAGAGYVVLAFDLRCFGERAETVETGAGSEPCEMLCARGALLGVNLLALHVHDTLRAIDYLCERDDVDSRRIACVGDGLGGTVAMWASAIDKRIRAAAIADCFFDLDLPRTIACSSQCVPALRRYFNTSDLAVLIAPRPLLVAKGAANVVEPRSNGLWKLRSAYGIWGAREAVSHVRPAGGRSLPAAAVRNWLSRWL